MKFPEGRQYTIQLAPDELIELYHLVVEHLPDNVEADSVFDRLVCKVSTANTFLLQDRAMRSLLDDADRRSKWLRERLVKLMSSK
jgi:hypothetical protein